MVGNYPFPLCGGRLGPALQYTVCRQILVTTPSPLCGGRLGWGEEVLTSPPPQPSPIEGEGSYSKATRMKYLPLSAQGE
jgi:hypothetical protein